MSIASSKTLSFTFWPAEGRFTKQKAHRAPLLDLRVNININIAYFEHPRLGLNSKAEMVSDE